MGEGAGIVVLEEYEHARKRGAKIYAELVGYGLSGDAYHITAPSPDGDGALRSMQAAIRRAKVDPSEIDYINAHGTSTPLGDEIELAAVHRLVGNAAGRISMSSTKSSIGHLLGAAGAVEAIFSILAIRDGIAPPTINLDNPSVETAIDLVPHQARKREIDTVLSNSFGFGGTNASLVFRRVEAGRMPLRSCSQAVQAFATILGPNYVRGMSRPGLGRFRKICEYANGVHERTPASSDGSGSGR